jgi:hypothetical protein
MKGATKHRAPAFVGHAFRATHFERRANSFAARSRDSGAAKRKTVNVGNRRFWSFPESA